MNRRNKGRKKWKVSSLGNGFPLEIVQTGGLRCLWQDCVTAQYFSQDLWFCLLTLNDPEMVHLYLYHLCMPWTSYYPKVLQTMTYSVKPTGHLKRCYAEAMHYWCLQVSLALLFTFALMFILLNLKMMVSLHSLLWRGVMMVIWERKEHWDLVGY